MTQTSGGRGDCGNNFEEHKILLKQSQAEVQELEEKLHSQCAEDYLLKKRELEDLSKQLEKQLVNSARDIATGSKRLPT